LQNFILGSPLFPLAVGLLLIVAFGIVGAMESR
jgi:predicted outer membrane lipoprotein